MRKMSSLLIEKAERLIALAKDKKITLGTAESCTGGLVGAALTSVSGASAVFFGGIISYDNSVKEAVLGVKKETLLTVGAVSHDTAVQMAEGARRVLGTDLAVSVTGIAGPTGGTPAKPVGTVFIAVARRDGKTLCTENRFLGDRDAVRAQTVEKAITLLTEVVENV